MKVGTRREKRARTGRRRRNRRILVALACTGLVGAVLVPALGPGKQAAALLLRYTFPELALRSKYIVLGEVVALTSYKAPFQEAGELFFTDVTVKVERALKGSPEGADVTVQILGGKVGGEGYSCLESAKYEKGEKVLIFLRDFNGRLWNTGWLQGKYRIVNGTTVKGATDLPIATDAPLATVESWVQAYLAPPPSGAPGTPFRRTEGTAR